MFEIVICGRGGQGVIFLTRQIGETAAGKGLDVIGSETHGMAQRGGSVNSHLRMGPFSSSLIRQGHADLIISMDPQETKNNLHFLKPGGLIVESSPDPAEDGVVRVDSVGLARQLGRVQLENVVLLGAAAGLDKFPLSVDDIRSQLAKHPSEKVRETNLKALEAGSAAVS